MELLISGKSALVTGAAQGIGLAIVKSLAKEGVKVFLNDLSEEKAKTAAATLIDEIPDAKIRGIGADLGNSEGVSKLIHEVPDADIVINNVGIYEPKKFEDISDEDWMRLFEINVLSAVRISRTYFPRMLRAGWGRIIYVSSESAVNIPGDMIHYGMTKIALLAIARGLAEMTKGTEVTVNSILPGPTASEGSNVHLSKLAEESNLSLEEMEKEFFRTFRPDSLVGRRLTTEEIASMAAFLCSPIAVGTNGSAVRVDGGLIRSPI
jgi:NAD(P)-dependent dehydrogenase (short-subunit alcohol dehydrogenase family)